MPHARDTVIALAQQDPKLVLVECGDVVPNLSEPVLLLLLGPGARIHLVDGELPVAHVAGAEALQSG